MTVESEFRQTLYLGNGMTTLWPIPFDFLLPLHIFLQVRSIGAEDWTLVPRSAYEVLGNNVRYPIIGNPLPVTQELRISRHVPFIQMGVNLSPSSGYNPQSVEDELDLAVMRDQQLRDGEAGIFGGLADLTAQRLLTAQVEDLTTAVCLIPGTTPFGYGTTVVTRSTDDGVTFTEPVNNNKAANTADIVFSITQLRDTFPNCRRILLVISWFGDDLRVGECRVLPMRESEGELTSPRQWTAGGVAYGDAEVTPQVNDRAIYGSSPDDQSLIECITFLKQSGFQVVILPFMMMTQMPGNGLPDPYGGAEQAPLPWRGRITVMPGDEGTAAARTQVDEFFERATFGYRGFIQYLTQIAAAAGGVYGFCVGSELPGITSIQDDNGDFPGVEQLITLVEEVKLAGVASFVGYASDWTEFHGKFFGDDFIYNLDPLWAACDFVGIDDYMPLADWRDGTTHLDYLAGFAGPHDEEYITTNIEGGELYDWFYASQEDRRDQVRTPITDGGYDTPEEFRFKDLRWWWNNLHFNRIDGVRESEPTAWAPQSKSIWLTEFGIPSVDKAANQPNVFYTASKGSVESNFPYFSHGTEDRFAQRTALAAKLRYWNLFNESSGGVQMIDPANIYIWTWDARPFPEFPRLFDIWTDGVDWRLGHWINGKFGQGLRLGIETRPETDFVMQLQRVKIIDAFISGEVTELTPPFEVGSIIFGAGIEVLEEITGAETISLGDLGDGEGVSADDERYGKEISPDVGSRAYNPITPLPIYGPMTFTVSAFDALEDPVAATGGRVRVRVVYLTPLA